MSFLHNVGCSCTHQKPQTYGELNYHYHRPIHDPEVLYDAEAESSDDEDEEEARLMSHRLAAPPSSSER